MEELDDIEIEMENLDEKHREEISEVKKRHDQERKLLKEKRKMKRAELKKQLGGSQQNQNIQCATQ